MQSEPERLDDDEVYELDREAWNLPRPRAQLEIASTPNAPLDDGSCYGPHLPRKAERAT